MSESNTDNSEVTTTTTADSAVSEEVTNPVTTEHEPKADSDFDKAVQEKVQSIITDRLARSGSQIKKLQDGIDAANNAKKASEEEVEKLSGEVVSLRETNNKLQLALSEGVSFEIVDSLKGDTIEELRASLAKVNAAQPKMQASDLFGGKSYATASPESFKSDIDALERVRF